MTATTPTAHDLLDGDELAELLGIKPTTLRTMRSRPRPDRTIAGLPAPLRLVSGRPVWSRLEVERWLEQRST